MKRPGQCTPKVTNAVIEITEICCNYTVAWKEYDFCKPFKQECWSNSSKVPTVPGLNLEVSSLELNASLFKLECIRQNTEHDSQMLMLKETIIQGWPKDIKQCPLPLCSFWNFRDELSIIDGIVVKGNHIVILTNF